MWLLGWLIILVPMSATAQVDQAPAINAAILEAIENEQDSYTLPRTVTIASRIVLPSWVNSPLQNFTLRGAPGTGTTITALSPVVGMITLGNETTNPNDVFTGANLESWNLLPVVMGSQTIQLASGSPPPITLCFYTIVDDQRENTNSTPVNAEMVRIIGYNPTTRVATLDRPVGRPFSLNPKLRFTHYRTTTNITIRDITLVGGTPLWGSEGGFNISMVAGLNLTNVKTRFMRTDNIRLQFCRDVIVDGYDHRDYVFGDVAGWGRGTSVFYCKDVTLANGYSESLRHGISMIASSSDVLVRDCVGNDTLGNSFDIHGMLSYRTTFLRCTGSGQFQVGNGTFWTGDRDTLIQDCHTTGGIVLIGDARNTRILNSSARYLQFQSFGTLATEFRPKDTYVEGSTFVNSDPNTGPVMFSGTPWKSIRNLTMVNCFLHEQNGPGARALLFEDAKSNLGLLKFVGTRFSTKNSAGTGISRPVEITGTGTNASMTFELRACQLETDGTILIWFGTGLSGTGLITGWVAPPFGFANPILNNSAATLPLTIVTGGRWTGGGTGAPPP